MASAAVTHRTAMSSLRSFIVNQYHDATSAAIVSKIDELENQIKSLKSDSGYARQPSDLYSTPAWVTVAAIEWMEQANMISVGAGPIWECAAGEHAMVDALSARGYEVFASDINAPPHGRQHVIFDMTSKTPSPAEMNGRHQAIFTNPPYDRRIVDRFVTSALERAPVVAMLLPVNFDSAKGRRSLFSSNPRFAAKLTLTSRIRWFSDKSGKSPMKNHAWYVWTKHGRNHGVIGQIPIPGGEAEAMEKLSRPKSRRKEN